MSIIQYVSKEKKHSNDGNSTAKQQNLDKAISLFFHMSYFDFFFIDRQKPLYHS